MKPTKFKYSNATLARPSDMTEEECGPLPIFQDSETHATISCWKMSWRERFSALFFGRVWVWVHSGGTTQPPIALAAKKEIFEERKR